MMECVSPGRDGACEPWKEGGRRRRGRREKSVWVLMAGREEGREGQGGREGSTSVPEA